MARNTLATAAAAACLAGFFLGAWAAGRFGEAEVPPQPETEVAEAGPASPHGDQAASRGIEQRLARIEAKLDRLLVADPAPPGDRPPNVLLIVPDTLAGHLVGFNGDSCSAQFFEMKIFCELVCSGMNNPVRKAINGHRIFRRNAGNPTQHNRSGPEEYS